MIHSVTSSDFEKEKRKFLVLKIVSRSHQFNLFSSQFQPNFIAVGFNQRNINKNQNKIPIFERTNQTSCVI